MIPCKIEFHSKEGDKCSVHGSIVRTFDYVNIFSFEGSFKYRVHKDKIIDINQIDLNDEQCE